MTTYKDENTTEICVPIVNRYWGTGSMMRMAEAVLDSVCFSDDGAETGESALLLERRFLKLVERNNALITKICFYFASDNVEFDDLRQDVLLNLWRGIRGFRGDSRESTWIYRVSFNTCVSSVKRNRKGSLPSLNGMEVDIPESSEEDDEREGRIALLHHCISQLDPVDRSIVMMQLDGNSYEEIAEVIGMNRNTVATRLNRARKRISQIFKEREDKIY